MVEAIFGLLGVVIGGGLTGGVDVLAKRREERAMTRTLARTIFAALTDLHSQCVYCLDHRSWLLVAEPLRLPAAWTDHELILGRLLTWDQWVGLEAVCNSQFALRMLAVQAVEVPGLEHTHLPTITDAAVAAIDNVLPGLERLAGSSRATLPNDIERVRSPGPHRGPLSLPMAGGMWIRLADAKVPRPPWWWVLLALSVRRSNRQALKAAEKVGRDLGESVVSAGSRRTRRPTPC